MPQMAPLMWIILFFTFTGLFLLSAHKVYYSRPALSPESHTLQGKDSKMGPLTWKW